MKKAIIICSLITIGIVNATYEPPFPSTSNSSTINNTNAVRGNCKNVNHTNNTSISSTITPTNTITQSFAYKLFKDKVSWLYNLVSTQFKNITQNLLHTLKTKRHKLLLEIKNATHQSRSSNHYATPTLNSLSSYAAYEYDVSDSDHNSLNENYASSESDSTDSDSSIFNSKFNVSEASKDEIKNLQDSLKIREIQDQNTKDRCSISLVSNVNIFKTLLNNLSGYTNLPLRFPYWVTIHQYNADNILNLSANIRISDPDKQTINSLSQFLGVQNNNVANTDFFDITFVDINDVQKSGKAQLKPQYPFFTQDIFKHTNNYNEGSKIHVWSTHLKANGGVSQKLNDTSSKTCFNFHLLNGHHAISPNTLSYNNLTNGDAIIYRTDYKGNKLQGQSRIGVIFLVDRHTNNFSIPLQNIAEFSVSQNNKILRDIFGISDEIKASMKTVKNNNNWKQLSTDQQNVIILTLLQIADNPFWIQLDINDRNTICEEICKICKDSKPYENLRIAMTPDDLVKRIISFSLTKDSRYQQLPNEYKMTFWNNLTQGNLLSDNYVNTILTNTLISFLEDTNLSSITFDDRYKQLSNDYKEIFWNNITQETVSSNKIDNVLTDTFVSFLKDFAQKHNDWSKLSPNDQKTIFSAIGNGITNTKAVEDWILAYL